MSVQSIATIAQGDVDALNRTTTVKVVRDGEPLFTQSFRYVAQWLKERGYRPVLGFGYWVLDTNNATTH